MIARRTALVRTFLLTLGNLVALLGCKSPQRPSRPPRPDPTGAATPLGTPAEQLDCDLARLGKRTYSDQGIGVFLVCENRVGTKADSTRIQRRGNESRQLAAEFRRQVEVFKQLRPNRTDDDVPKLIEVLADRDLAKRTQSPRP